ncbi:MAG: aminoacyl-histidine dipeptidase [Candidatus Glassbacteria bacterium]|nr:aminoacyl-histidine dipeptidase [Candidatus Glassbacteria bacterium]
MDQDVKVILELFERINAVPRESKQEERISQWLQEWGKNAGLTTRADKLGNVVIEIPGSAGCEDAPTVVLQGHMDMVCEKTPDSDHDFSRDPVRSIIDGDWLTADRTTLGADNGIAIAMGLALAGRSDIPHPPLELLITVDEEQGLTGAARLEAEFVNGRIMLNLDSEDEGVFTIGCSGGRETVITLESPAAPLADTEEVYRITVSGLLGGHSGVDIDKHRACANKLLGRALCQAGRHVSLRLVSIEGGTAHNAIPREAEAVIACAAGQGGKLEKAVSAFEQAARAEFAASDRGVAIEAARQEIATAGALSVEDSSRVANLMNALPHGVIEMSADVEGEVETSNSFAVVGLREGKLHILTSQRSSVMSRIEMVSSAITSIAALAGAQCKFGSEYPSWPANLQSPLIGKCREVYSGLYGREPEFEIIHAGLECAVIGKIYPEMDMISLGPTIQNPHSPDERLNIPSLGNTWRFLLELLKELK